MSNFPCNPCMICKKPIELVKNKYDGVVVAGNFINTLDSILYFEDKSNDIKKDKSDKPIYKESNHPCKDKFLDVITFEYSKQFNDFFKVYIRYDGESRSEKLNKLLKISDRCSRRKDYFKEMMLFVIGHRNCFPFVDFKFYEVIELDNFHSKKRGYRMADDLKRNSWYNPKGGERVLDYLYRGEK